MFNPFESRVFFLAYFIFFITLCFIWPLIRLWRQEKIIAITFGNSDNAHDYIGKLFKFLIALAGVPVLALFIGKDFFSKLIPLSEFPSWCIVSGFILMIISVLWIMVAQIQMDHSWRIGIDYKKKTALVATGLFKYSRNPIYLGIHGSLAGIFLVIPNIFSFVILIIAHLLIQIQTRLEEEYLKSVHGQEYSEYCKKVRRWI